MPISYASQILNFSTKDIKMRVKEFFYVNNIDVDIECSYNIDCMPCVVVYIKSDLGNDYLERIHNYQIVCSNILPVTIKCEVIYYYKILRIKKFLEQIENKEDV